MPKILITGGLGYVGSKLASLLEERGHDVEIYDKPNDILNTVDLRRAITGKDAVYHLAALAELTYTDEHPQETYDVNIEGTNNVCRICAEGGVLMNFISTCCIYGDPLEVPSREDSIINPTDTYAMSKAAGEYIVKMWHLAKGLKYNILRLGTVYGPSPQETRGDMAIQIFIRCAKKGSPIPIKGDGKQNRCFVHLGDLAEGLAAVTEKGVVNETINLAGGEIVSIKEIADIALKLGQSKQIFYLPTRKDDFKYQDIYLGKAKRLLGWSPRIRFEDGFRGYYDQSK